ncbi:pyruvate carboxylase subunit B [Geoglobus sp.]
MDVYSKLRESVERYFREAEEGGFSYTRVQWELDNLIYPYIGSFLASGEISREQAEELFRMCEERLRNLKEPL